MKKDGVAAEDAPLPAEYSSPPCYAHEFPGYFGEDEADADLQPQAHCADRPPAEPPCITLPEAGSSADGKSHG